MESNPNFHRQAPRHQPGPDILRVLAIVLVLTTHAITYTGALNQNLFSLVWDVTLAARFTALACVPLFMLLTGYLNCRKQLTRGYFRRLLPIVFSYMGASVLALMARRVSGQEVTLATGILQVLDFTANGYAWYVKMYMGLFLFIPFLNLLWEQLNRPRRKLLLGILTVLSFGPATVQSFTVAGRTLSVIPDSWMVGYPLAYYYWGAWVATERPRPPRSRRWWFTVLAAALPVLLCYGFSRRDGAYAWYMMNGFQTLTVAALALGFFVCLYDVVRFPRPLAAVFGWLSARSLEIYLLSYVADQAILALHPLPWPLWVLASLALSCGGAAVLHFLAYRLAALFGPRTSPSSAKEGR